MLKLFIYVAEILHTLPLFRIKYICYMIIVAEIKSLQSHLTLEEIQSNDAQLRNQVFETTNLTYSSLIYFCTYL